MIMWIVSQFTDNYAKHISFYWTPRQPRCNVSNDKYFTFLITIILFLVSNHPLSKSYGRRSPYQNKYQVWSLARLDFRLPDNTTSCSSSSSAATIASEMQVSYSSFEPLGALFSNCICRNTDKPLPEYQPVKNVYSSEYKGQSCLAGFHVLSRDTHYLFSERIWIHDGQGWLGSTWLRGLVHLHDIRQQQRRRWWWRRMWRRK